VGVGGREGEAVESLPEGRRESAAHGLARSFVVWVFRSVGDVDE
jgi:hypothetical protein